LCADCKVLVTITASAGPPYEPGYNLTCDAEIYDKGDETDIPVYHWVGTNGGSAFSSNSSTVVLLGGEFCLYCVAHFDARTSKTWQPDYCSAYTSICDGTVGKCQKH